ncbi:MAG: DUF362 domain-containing protein [Candidatus Micrarchaeia archaeon]
MANKIFWAAGKDRENIALVLRQVEAEHPQLISKIRGARVLIKPNFVDPDIPRACSAPSTIGAVARWVIKHGASAVFVGDDGCIHAQKKARAHGIREFSRYAGEKLGLTKELEKIKAETGVAVSYLELSSLKTIQFQGIPLRDTSSFQVVSIALPKVHGEFVFSGACKNLIGLIPGERREEVVHPTLPLKMEMKVLYRKVEDRLVLLDKPHTVRIPHPDYQKQHDVMQRLIRHIQNAGNFLLHILDGMIGLFVHEHCGNAKELNFAVAGSNPVDVDVACYTALGIPAGSVFYLPDWQDMRGTQIGILDEISRGLWIGREF